MADNTIDTKSIAEIANQSTVETNKNSAAAGAATTAGKTEGLGQDEFLTLLVNQLQHQDPLNPMDSEEFAVQLAQFSQLEQLIGINNKIGGESSGFGSAGSMASFLGHEVVVSDGKVSIDGSGSGSNVLLDIPNGAQSARIDLIDEAGNTAGSINIENPESGRQVIELKDVNVPAGDYLTRAVVVDGSGQFADVDAKVTGTVEGFVLEPEPALIVNGEEVALESVSQVFNGKG